MYPTVSVITPTLNAAAVLEACLRSVREQDYPPEALEVIVADGGSTDGTQALAARDAGWLLSPQVDRRYRRARTYRRIKRTCQR